MIESAIVVRGTVAPARLISGYTILVTGGRNVNDAVTADCRVQTGKAEPRV